MFAEFWTRIWIDSLLPPVFLGGVHVREREGEGIIPWKRRQGKSEAVPAIVAQIPLWASARLKEVAPAVLDAVPSHCCLDRANFCANFWF